MTDWGARYAARMSRIVASDIRERMKLLGAKDIIQLGGGLPDPVLFPRERIAEASARILADPTLARTALQYAPSEGHPPLKEWLAGYMASIGAPCRPDNILVTNGSQQGLDFIGKLLISPGDTVAVELPSFIGALRAFDAYEPRYVRLPTEPGEGEPAKFGYVGTDFQNPTGTSLSRGARESLLDAAAALDMALVEDGCYEKLRFDGDDVPSLLALDIARTGSVDNGRVIYTNTFSKTIAPSFRVGWVVAPEPVIRKLTLIKQAADLATSAFNQMVMLEVARSSLEAEVARARAFYRTRRDSMMAALEAHMPPGVTWTRPEGGFYVWLTLPPKLDGDEVARRSLEEARVSIIAGRTFYATKPELNTVRLSYSLASEDAAREGVARLGKLLGAMIG
jgi:DNA-binding transcriptional MocR family regulator